MSDNRGGIPEEIVINGETIKVKDNQELLTLISHARKQEKNKLYAEITDLEAKVAKLGGKKGKDSEDNKILLELKEELKGLRDERKESMEKIAELEEAKKSAGKKTDAEKAQDKKDVQGMTQTKVDEMIQAALDKQSKTYESKMTALKGDLDSKKLSDYREKQLAKHGANIITDLVKKSGYTSEEEVDAAIEEALNTSKKYVTREYEDDKGVKSNVTIAEYERLQKEERDAAAAADADSKRTPDHTPPNPPPAPETGDSDVSKKDLLKNVADMSDDEYEKHRADILRQAHEVSYGES